MRTPHITRLRLAVAAAVVVASFYGVRAAHAASFDTSSSISGPNVVLTSTLTSGTDGNYRCTVTATLMGGGQETRSDVQSYTVGNPVQHTLVFSGTVASLGSPKYDPSS